MSTLLFERPTQQRVDDAFLRYVALEFPEFAAQRRPGGGDWTVTDLFCGAGGSSSGAESVPGVRVRMASNHWSLAIETHNTNMPHVDHDVADIAEVDPRRYPRTDFLWASPSCTFWSGARGERRDFTEEATRPTLFDLDNTDDEDDEQRALPAEAKQRSRALMHDVPRFAEHHRYRAVIVENTPELLKWWYFPKWIARMRTLGYRHRVLTLNSAFAHKLGAPAPQLRDRVYVVFWLAKYRDPDFDKWTRPTAWCPTCDRPVSAMVAPKDARKPYGSYWEQYTYRCPQVSCRHGIVHPYTLPAISAIDLSTPGTRIGDRKRPLFPKTMSRIATALGQFGPQSQVDALRSAVRRYPFLVPAEGRGGKVARSGLEPHRAQTARNETGLLVPAGGTWNEDSRPVWEPMRTRTTRESEALVLVPLRNNNRSKSSAEPLNTFAAGGNHHGLLSLTPWQATAADARLWDPNVLFAYDTGMFRSLRGPLPTQTTVTGDAVVEAGLDVNDCVFRMMLPDEVKRGMGFASRFVLLGNKREQVRMCGNAVTPPIARDLIAAVVEAITGDEVTPS
jgi:DNA (cytosine-5)-methyltransferase 1